ncbi:spc105-related isoform 2-T2 [Cochliomyia hominivorax]
MDTKKPQSSLRKSLAVDMASTDIKSQIKRRISFSGKNSVRVFYGEEEPKTWNNSYEISDHLNVNETASNLCDPSKSSPVRNVAEGNKENIQGEFEIDNNKKYFKNVSINNNHSVLSTTKDMINVSYQHQNSKLYQIDNSVDITLCEREIKYQIGKNKVNNETRSKIYSFSLEENEKEVRSVMFGERTIDFMQSGTNMKEDHVTIGDTKDGKGVTVFSEYMDEENIFMPVKDNFVKEQITIYMNDSVKTSENEEGKTLLDVTMEFSPNRAKQYNKENVNPISIHNANETVNNSCQMEIEEEIYSATRPIDLNVEKESLAFEEKLSRLSFLRESDDDMQMDYMESNTKSRPTINFNEAIEMSPKGNTRTNANKIHKSRSTININRSLDVSPKNIPNTSQITSRPTLNCNNSIEFSPKKSNNILNNNEICLNNTLSRPTINLSMELDTQNVVDSYIKQGAIPKNKNRCTMHFNQPIETTPLKAKKSESRNTVYLKEDICISPKISQKTVLANDLNTEGSMRKQCQVPKLIVRKICKPLVNKNKKPVDLEQERLLRYKKKHEENIGSNKATDEVTDAKNERKTQNNASLLNFSLNSIKNMSLSSEASSPLIPSEFKAYNLKQLNDELERGKICIFSNAPKTPTTDRKGRLVGSSFLSSTKHGRTLVFDDVDIPVTSEDTIKPTKSNNIYDFNITQDFVLQDGKRNATCRYSQADDMMLDNTSFLTKAKLSDETISRNNSKRDITRLNNIDIFDETLREAANNLGSGIKSSIIMSRKSCIENNSLSSMFQNAKPIFTQAVTNIKDIKLYDTMDISREIAKSSDEIQRTSDHTNQEKCQTLILNHGIDLDEGNTFMYSCNKTLQNLNEVSDTQINKKEDEFICENNEMEVDGNQNQQIVAENIQESETNSNIQKIYMEVNYPNKDIDKTVSAGSLKTNNSLKEPLNSNVTHVENLDNKVENYNDSYRKSYTMNANEDIFDEIGAHRENQHKNLENNNDDNRKRHTIYPNENVENEMETDPCYSRKQLEDCKERKRCTIHFDDNSINEEIEKNIEREKNTSVMETNNVKTGNFEKSICRTNHTRKTLYFNSEIPLEEVSMRIEENIQTQKTDRKTILFNKEIQIDNQLVKNEYNDDICIYKPTRKTIYFNSEVQIEKIDSVPDVKKGKHTEEDVDIILDGKEEESKTILNANCNMDIPMNNEITNNEIINEYNDLPGRENYNGNQETRKTLYFDNNNHISFDQSFTDDENFKFPETTKPLNAAKTTITRQFNKSLVRNKSENVLITPKKFPLIHMTPRLSLLEFTALETKTREEEQLHRMEYLSPFRKENTNKRYNMSITPILSIPKKRALLFDDCVTDEKNMSIEVENSHANVLNSNEMGNDIKGSKVHKQEQDVSKFVIRNSNSNEMDISGVVANDSFLQTPPKQRKSRIPIPISCEKKSRRSISMLQNCNDQNKDSDDQLDIEGDTLGASIQVMRRATTFTQMRDKEIKCNELKNNDPITISDVSVFFEAQRKSNSLAPEAETSLVLEKINMSEIKAIEKAKKTLENRYLNLTLEDIDKTRLSLVKISYEDGTVGNTNMSINEYNENYERNMQALIDEVINNDMSPDNNRIVNDNGLEVNANRKSSRRSVNYLRNESAICRKCKRCQNTILNETTSSTSDSFVLPALPPLPDLGLERLGRLRKRPSIADVNILWQRVSLDRTIINDLNISDDGSHITSDIDDDDDESSPLIKCIRKFENEMLSFEMDLLRIEENKPCTQEISFVERLSTLLCTNSTNWIFNFQMQYRGILLFTHKKMYTFSLSLSFDEVDPFGRDICVKSVKLENGICPEKNWKPIDFVLDFQFKLNLPFNLDSLCKSGNEADVFKMLQTIDKVCLNTVKMGNQLQRICFSTQSSIIKDENRTFVRKIVRKIVNTSDSDIKHVDKTVIKVELLNLKKMSFRDIAWPRLYNFLEDIHLLPTGLSFLQEFLRNPLKYLKH